MAALVCDAGPDCHRIKSGKKPPLKKDRIQVHKQDDLTGKVFNLCDLREFKLHKHEYELTAAGEAAQAKKKGYNAISNPKYNADKDAKQSRNAITNNTTTHKNNEAKTATMSQAQQRGMDIQLKGTGFKDKWLQAMHKYSRGAGTKAKATKAFMKGKRVGFVFAQGRHRGRKEKAGMFTRGDDTMPPLIIKV